MDATEALAAALQSVLYPGEDIDRDENLWIEQDTKRDAAAILAALDGYVLVPVGLVEAAREVVDATTSYVIRDAAIRTALAALRAALASPEPARLDEPSDGTIDRYRLIQEVRKAARGIDHSLADEPDYERFDAAILALEAAAIAAAYAEGAKE